MLYRFNNSLSFSKNNLGWGSFDFVQSIGIVEYSGIHLRCRFPIHKIKIHLRLGLVCTGCCCMVSGALCINGLLRQQQNTVRFDYHSSQ